MTRSLLLTATITPLLGIPSLSRIDPNERLNDYIATISYYVRLELFDVIVFAENSNTNLDIIINKVNKISSKTKVEFISFDGLNFPATHGRGYGEMKIIEYAFQNSVHLKMSSVIWKCTGRYIVENIAKLVDSRPDVEFYCHCRNHPYKLCELFMFSFYPSAYSSFIENVATRIRNDIIPNVHSNEEMLYRKFIDEIDNTQIVKRLKYIPIINGVRGWDNKPYSTRNSPKNIIRRFFNFILPAVWF
jgi:hypothetical protein